MSCGTEMIARLLGSMCMLYKDVKMYYLNKARGQVENVLAGMPSQYWRVFCGMSTQYWKGQNLKSSVKSANRLKTYRTSRFFGTSLYRQVYPVSPTKQQVDISVWNQNIMTRAHNKE